MRKFESIYDFYHLSDDEAKSLIGQVIQESERKKQKPSAKRNTPIYPKRWAVFFPVGLTEAEFNYGKQIGLIGVSNVFDHWKDKQPYFRVYAMSPDDLDIGITIEGSHANECHEKVVKFMASLPFENVTYREVMELIVDHIGCGEIEM